MTTNHTLELARFKVALENVDAMLADRPAAVSHIAAQYDDFVTSRLVRVSDTEFMDIVEWKSLDTAKKAGEEVMQYPECQKYFRHIAELVSMEHATVVV
jgi:hypothetical protein